MELPFYIDLAIDMAALARFWQAAGLSFVVLFVAIDPVGVVPLAMAVIGETTAKERARIINIAALTAAVIGVLFLLVGQVVLTALGINVDHFAIAGGLVLLAIALRELAGGVKVEAPSREEMVSVVPIGTPLLAGPATVTTLLLLSSQYGFWPVFAAFVVNLVVAWVILRWARLLLKVLGRGGLAAITKIVYMFLAAIAVRMIVEGIRNVFL